MLVVPPFTDREVVGGILVDDPCTKICDDAIYAFRETDGNLTALISIADPTWGIEDFTDSESCSWPLPEISLEDIYAHFNLTFGLLRPVVSVYLTYRDGQLAQVGVHRRALQVVGRFSHREYQEESQNSQSQLYEQLRLQSELALLMHRLNGVPKEPGAESPLLSVVSEFMYAASLAVTKYCQERGIPLPYRRYVGTRFVGVTANPAVASAGNKPVYARFTSPLQDPLDRIAHLQVLAYLAGTPVADLPFSQAELEEILPAVMAQDRAKRGALRAKAKAKAKAAAAAQPKSPAVPVSASPGAKLVLGKLLQKGAPDLDTLEVKVQKTPNYAGSQFLLHALAFYTAFPRAERARTISLVREFLDKVERAGREIWKLAVEGFSFPKLTLVLKEQYRLRQVSVSLDYQGSRVTLHTDWFSTKEEALRQGYALALAKFFGLKPEDLTERSLLQPRKATRKQQRQQGLDRKGEVILPYNIVYSFTQQKGWLEPEFIMTEVVAPNGKQARFTGTLALRPTPDHPALVVTQDEPVTSKKYLRQLLGKKMWGLLIQKGELV